MINKHIKAVRKTMDACGVPMIRMYYSTPSGEPCSVHEPMHVRTSADGAALVKGLFADVMDLQESFKVVLLNRGNKVIGVYDASRGGGHSTTVDASMIYAAALLGNAKALIFTHNHPSGQLRPSPEDISITKQLVDGARLMGMTVQDHIIITSNGHFSFADNGML